ncbi:unnamed protein product [Alopecurus aequalis]
MVRQAVSNEAGAAHGQTTRRKSAVWKDFDYVDVPGASAMATCKRCGTTLTACPKKHGTSHLRRHAGSSSCTTRAAERVAPCLPAAAPVGDDDEDVWITKMVEELLIDPESDAGLFAVDEQLDTGTSAGSPFSDGRQVDGEGEVAVAGDHDRRSPNCMPDTRMPQAPSLSSTRFFQKKRERFAYLASHQGGTTDKDHSSRVNTDWEPTVDNSMVYADFTFGDAYD